eukprot:GHVR01139357.1.p1 GENE.GHVR01139357.1~~GHVR01139357.1.p1  ORF type:complete len:148 (-),score=40.07 GHVR01139357.1:47-490(-)
MSDEKKKTVPLESLSQQQMVQCKQIISQEVNELSSAVQMLKIAQGKLNTSIDALSHIHKDIEGNEMLIPMTSSLYVKGELVETDEVLVDIGTGFHVVMSVEDAKKHFAKKEGEVKKQMNMTSARLTEKKKFCDTLDITLQAKGQESQ